MKVHLHHSHITGKIVGYAHNFCNARVRKNNMEIPVTTHNLFGNCIILLRVLLLQHGVQKS